MEYVLSIDQSTSATKAIIFEQTGKLIARDDISHRQIISRQGWVSHNPEEIMMNVIETSRRCIVKSGLPAASITSVGISNQRETALCWNRSTGKAIADAIVWQCDRATQIAERLSLHSDEIRRRTGLRHSPFFSAPKWAWILENVPEAKALMASGNLCCGTIDSWLVFNLTKEHYFRTDFSNASRTELLNIDSLQWDDTIAEWFGIEIGSLPAICESDSIFGMTDLRGVLPTLVPIHAVMGDSSAALYANGCNRKGMSKATFGTGTSVMMNAGTSRPQVNPDGCVESIAWVADGTVMYAIEGNINYSGAIIKWLVDCVHLINSSREAGELAETVDSTNGVYFVPAFSGLGAPYWVNDVHAIICGVNTTTTNAHIVRAAEEAIAYQICDIVKIMEGSNMPLSTLFVDGGATKDQFLMSFVADILDLPLRVSSMDELSAAGVAYMALISSGASKHEDIQSGLLYEEIMPNMESEARSALYAGWKKAVSLVINSAESK